MAAERSACQHVEWDELFYEDGTPVERDVRTTHQLRARICRACGELRWRRKRDPIKEGV